MAVAVAVAASAISIPVSAAALPITTSALAQANISCIIFVFLINFVDFAIYLDICITMYLEKIKHLQLGMERVYI